MILALGKTYKTRDGKHAVIIARVPDPVVPHTEPWLGAITAPEGFEYAAWFEGGEHTLTGDDPLDIIEEWTLPITEEKNVCQQ